MKRTNRRQFLKDTAKASATIWAAYTLTTVSAKAQGSKNDRPRVGLIGLGAQGCGLSHPAAAHGNIVALCDVNTEKIGNARRHLGDRVKDNVATYQDYRKLLDRNDIDVIIQATADHWHTKVNIDAMRSGRDVYAEKPLTLTIDEGKLLCKVVKETGRVFQVGTQQRSGREFQTAVELVRNGRVGTLKQVWVAIPFLSMKGGPFTPEPVPDTLDWDLYQGQAPSRPFTSRRYHPYRGWFDYCNSMAPDWGSHHMDIAHWGMDADSTGPTTIEGRGLWPNEGKPDHYDVPDRLFARMMYANDVEMLFFVSMDDRHDPYLGPVEPHVTTTQEQRDWMFGKDVPDEVKTFNRNGVMFIGDKGRIFVNRGGLYGRPVEELAENPFPSDAWRVPQRNNHMKNFFDCVQTRETPIASAEVGHHSVTACHLSVISIRLGGRKIQWDPVKEEIVGDSEAKAMQAREQRKPYEIA